MVPESRPYLASRDNILNNPEIIGRDLVVFSLPEIIAIRGPIKKVYVEDGAIIFDRNWAARAIFDDNDPARFRWEIVDQKNVRVPADTAIIKYKDGILSFLTVEEDSFLGVILPPGDSLDPSQVKGLVLPNSQPEGVR